MSSPRKHLGSPAKASRLAATTVHQSGPDMSIFFGLKLGTWLPVTETSSIVIKKKLAYSDLYHLADVATKVERAY